MKTYDIKNDHWVSTIFECEKTSIKLEMKEPQENLKEFYPVFYYIIDKRDSCRITEEIFNAIKSMMV